MNYVEDPLEIDADPTKELFIEMLVRDIPLIRAIIDLIDNSVDGAIRSGKEDYSEYYINIELNKDHFRIYDNCGGIPIDIAKHYAFRFGRPKKLGPTPNSIGQFGVGMKRTFFKLGNIFYVESKTSSSSFVINVDVDEWKNRPEWKFRFNELTDNLKIKKDSIGTRIEITALHEYIANQFDLDNFKTELSKEIEKAHYINMDKGLVINFNGIPLRSNPLKLLHSDQLRPVHWESSFLESTGTPVKVQIYAGLSERKLRDGGWYIFCNGRMVLESDQSLQTGWGEGDGKVIPKYHADFAFFRGYAFFESENASLLPWTTTKTGIDSDSPLYKTVRVEMIKLMRPILDFLRQVAGEEATEGEDGGYLLNVINSANTSKFFEIQKEQKFVAPKPLPKVVLPATNRIQYDKPTKEVDIVKKVLKAKTLKEVGERTFDYFYKMECGE